MNRRLCSLPRQPAPSFAAGLTAGRQGAPLAGRRMWVDGTVPHHCFLGAGSTETREYTVGTCGDADTVLVVFEERDGEPRFLAGHGGSGGPDNAVVGVRLVKGRRYLVRVRLHSTGGPGETAVMCR